MKNRLFVFISLLLCNCAAMTAQNKIDALVETCSSTGNTSFTSVVERDPATRKVKKVVKMLSITNNDVPKFRSAFESESGTGQYIVNSNNDSNSYMLITGDRHKTRIYMLEYRRNRDGSVTIIIK
ncbi:DUF5024 domain-containing protein [Xylanibacter caecicola]|uniref:DUF5024 domain-containing protein n=1 Tax=Xylanibacter caecicola TaxID=2736294 RepID=UPI0025906016|nr:DUF5024 domain-containing protein [Xylanibacter caecicola]